MLGAYPPHNIRSVVQSTLETARRIAVKLSRHVVASPSRWQVAVVDGSA